MDRAMVIRKKVHINVKGSLFCTLVDVCVSRRPLSLSPLPPLLFHMFTFVGKKLKKNMAAHHLSSLARPPSPIVHSSRPALGGQRTSKRLEEC